MPIEKCPKCGDEYDPMYSFHSCQKSEIDKQQRGRNNISGLKSILIIIGGVLLVLFLIGSFSSPSVKPEEGIPQKSAEEKTNTDLASIIAQWRPIIAYVECEFHYADTGVIYEKGAGSGVVVYLNDGSISVLTNRHVIINELGYGANSCNVMFPENNNIFKIINTYPNENTPIKNSLDGKDWGILRIDYPNQYIKNITSSGFNRCSQKASIGDEIIILGYPGIGSQTDITATRGIISGYDGDYYITDAKIEHGNSGGAAILLKDNCYLGIPSFVMVGEIESLGRILDNKIIWSK